MLTALLRRMGYERKARPFAQFLSFKETIKAAKAAGLSVGEYLERRHMTGSRTARDLTMDGMAELGVFNGKIERICEIGPGSGRYMDKTIARCRPNFYEIYETSSEWRDWLISQYQTQARRCDGRTLAETESGSVDLVQAHKLFSGIPTLSTLSYYREMARVTKAGGWIVFDILSEICFKQEPLQRWFEANPWDWDWSPHFMGRDYTVDFFAQREIGLIGSFQIPQHPAVAECMVFRKATGRSEA